MTLPVLSVLFFALWTYLLLFSTIGWYRWSRILTGRSPISSFTAVNPEGADWYKRAMRAHANCIENLPVFAAVVFAIYVAGIESTTIDLLAVTVPIARVGQTVVHVMLPETNNTVTVRFAFFFTQVVCVLAIAIGLFFQIS